MSDYKIENREEVVRVLTERVISNAPIRELLRVYQEAVTAALEQLNDADVVRSLIQAGYIDIMEGFNLPEPPAPESSEAAEGEALLAE
jgi:hypothetical protein